MPRKTVAAIGVLALALAGCGGRAGSPSDREWRANAQGVVQQLRQDVGAVDAFDTPRAARIGLRNESQLYGLLVSYTDFGGCGHMVAALGVGPQSLAAAQRQLALACSHLRAADAYFTRAVARADPQLLMRATTAAVQSLAPLERAELALRR